MTSYEPSYFRDRGAYFVCPTCKKSFYVEDREAWVFKRNVTIDKNGSQMVYFHTYTCKKKFDKEYDKQIKQNRQDGAFKRHGTLKKKRQPKPRPELEEFCGDCQFCGRTNLGFYDCGYYDCAVAPHKVACGRFIGKEVVEA